ncbi:MAG: hypothetical protein ABIH48_00520 [Candidatus Falkowbacteria bacterium]
MSNQSIFTKLLTELQQNKNHNASIERCKEIIIILEQKLNKRVISYFSSEIGSDTNTMINDEDVFIIENLLSIKRGKKDLVLILHSNGGIAISAERIIDVCRSYCMRNSNKFIVIVPKKAKSAATIIALAADKIYLRHTAELGAVDPQFIITDKDGNVHIEPAYLQVDALEDIFDIESNNLWQKYFNKNSSKPLSRLPNGVKLKLLEQCNYPMYVNAKNELGLSDSIIKKIAEAKIKQNSKISLSDFDIFRDPHVTKSHGRLINLSDLKLKDNNLYKEKIIDKLDNLFDTKSDYEDFDLLLWEFYVRKRQLLNDPGNNIVKTIEEREEFFMNFGMKKGQIKTPPKKEELKK